MNIIEEMAVTLVMALLSKVIKNPKGVQIETAVLQQVRDSATLALASVDPTAPPPPGYVAAS